LKKTLIIMLIGFLVFISGGCENPSDNGDKVTSNTNTLNDSSLDNNFIGSASEYFYNLEEDVNVKFYHWSQEDIRQPILFDPNSDTLNFRTIPEFLVNIQPGEPGEQYTDLNNNGVYDDGEPFEDQGNSTWDLGEPFTDANGNGFFDVGEDFEDLDDNGFWTGTERLMDVNGDCVWNDAETWEEQIDDGIWTAPEPLTEEYMDYGVWNPHEPYTDEDGSGDYTPDDEYDDVNLDGVWTGHEPFDDLNGNGEWDAEEPFEDRNDDGIFDIGEPYDDTNNDCNWTDQEPYAEVYNASLPEPISGCNCVEIEVIPNFLYFYTNCGNDGVYEPECGDTFPFSGDLNDNGIHDGAEAFTDTDGNIVWDGDFIIDENGNCLHDPEEPYEDIYFPFGEFNPDEPITLDYNDNDIWDEHEQFEDLNGDGEWNDDEEFVDWNGDDVWTPGEPLVEYFENDVWDDAEGFIDVNGNGEWDNDGEGFSDMDSNCIWDVGESFLDNPELSTPSWDGYTDRHSIIAKTVTITDSVSIFSSQYTHLNQMIWNFELERYEADASAWEGQDTTIHFLDSFDSLVYQQQILELPDENESYYIDESEWIENLYVYSAGPSLFENTFTIRQKIIGSDSLLYRLPADCNLNGLGDSAEPFTDLNGDGNWDAGEPYEDFGNGNIDLQEPYLERNITGNIDGVRDNNEPYVDLNCNGEWDDEETIDTGNGIWDDEESYADVNANGVWDIGEGIYTTSLLPNSLQVSYDNYPDLSNPRILERVSSEEWFFDCGEDLLCPGDIGYEDSDTGEGNGILDDGEEFQDFNGDGEPFSAADSLRTITGEWIHNIIMVIEYGNYRTKEIANVDSMVTIYSNNIIETIDINGEDNDYYIAKTQWQYEESTNPGILLKEYDYHILKSGTHINKLVHPSYFLPPGFWGNTDGDGAHSEGFWFENFTVDEILYYTPGYHFRDGERFVMDTTIVTSVGDYYIQKSFAVDSDAILVPARKVLGHFNGEGVVVCEANNFAEVLTIEECPEDSLFTNLFKITNQLEMTMIGPGIAYGEKTITWLSSGHGVIKEQVFYRWNQAPWGTDHEWIELSMIELKEYRPMDNSGGGLMRNLFGNSHNIRLDRFQNEPALDNDPYEKHRTAGFQRVSIPTNNN